MHRSKALTPIIHPSINRHTKQIADACLIDCPCPCLHGPRLRLTRLGSKQQQQQQQY